MNAKIKAIITIITIVVFIFGLPIYSKAFSVDEIIGDAQGFISEGNGSGGVDPGRLESISDTVSGVLLAIAVAVTFISIGVMGIQFAVQTVEDKAKVKEAMVPWIIGILISFGAFGIWRFIMNVFYGMSLFN